MKHNLTRRATMELIQMADEGVIGWEFLAKELTGWMSEADVAKFLDSLKRELEL